jgi:hypothetical protein
MNRERNASESEGCTLWSPLFNIDHVRNDPLQVSRQVAAYLRILAEPVRVARAMVVPSKEDSQRDSIPRPVSVPSVARPALPAIPVALREFAHELTTQGRAALSIRELLGWFGAQRRGKQVLSIVTTALDLLIAEGHGALHPLRDRLATDDIDQIIRLNAPRSEAVEDHAD